VPITPIITPDHHLYGVPPSAFCSCSRRRRRGGRLGLLLALVVAFGWLTGREALQVLANRRFWLFVLSTLAIAPFITHVHRSLLTNPPMTSRPGP
jgi:hypothetical protein